MKTITLKAAIQAAFTTCGHTPRTLKHRVTGQITVDCPGTRVEVIIHRQPGGDVAAVLAIYPSALPLANAIVAHLTDQGFPTTLDTLTH